MDEDQGTDISQAPLCRFELYPLAASLARSLTDLGKIAHVLRGYHVLITTLVTRLFDKNNSYRHLDDLLLRVKRRFAFVKSRLV